MKNQSRLPMLLWWFATITASVVAGGSVMYYNVHKNTLSIIISLLSGLCLLKIYPRLEECLQQNHLTSTSLSSNIAGQNPGNSLGSNIASTEEKKDREKEQNKTDLYKAAVINPLTSANKEHSSAQENKPKNNKVAKQLSEVTFSLKALQFDMLDLKNKMSSQERMNSRILQSLESLSNAISFSSKVNNKKKGSNNNISSLAKTNMSASDKILSSKLVINTNNLSRSMTGQIEISNNSTSGTEPPSSTAPATPTKQTPSSNDSRRKSVIVSPTNNGQQQGATRQ